MALNGRAASWAARPPLHPVIAAGFIAADPALAALIAAVARLPLGLVVLPGLDRGLDNESWDSIEPTHPQHGLKSLLGRMGVRAMRSPSGPPSIQRRSPPPRPRSDC